MSISGVNDVLKRLKKLEKEILEAQAKGMEKTIDDIAEQSLKEAPLDKGPLRESFRAHVNNSEIRKGDSSGNATNVGEIKPEPKLSGILSYDTKYAVIQHETAEFNHPTPGTKWKYLEDPFKQHSKNLLRNTADEMKKVIK